MKAASKLRTRHGSGIAAKPSSPGTPPLLDYLHQAEPGPLALTIGLVLHFLHRLLFSFCDGGGGHFKLDDNVVVDRHPDGSKTTRFVPVAAETEHYMCELVDRTNDALDEGVVHPLLIAAAFGLDLLRIHPFADGNGRVTPLITAHPTRGLGTASTGYVSVEQLIFDTKEDYYATLAASTRLVRRRRAQRVAAGQVPSVRCTGRGGDSGSYETEPDPRLRATARPDAVLDLRIRRAVRGVYNTIRLVLTELKAAGGVTVDGTGRGSMWSRVAACFVELLADGRELFDLGDGGSCGWGAMVDRYANGRTGGPGGDESADRTPRQGTAD